MAVVVWGALPPLLCVVVVWWWWWWWSSDVARLVAFGGVSNSDHFRSCMFILITAHFRVYLKS